MGKLFGTDGIRGIANTELTCELAMNIGRATAMILLDRGYKQPTVLIGKDTRISSNMLEQAIVAGLCSVGANAVLLGVVPTPAVSYLAPEFADAGIMISASHNSFEFNGIKIFDKDGLKLTEEEELLIEAILAGQAKPYPQPWKGEIGRISRREEIVEQYVSHVADTCLERFLGFSVVLDCANGSATRTAEALFSKAGASVTMQYNHPDGININRDCGSTHVEQLAEFMKTHSFDAGFAFDGDADRCIAVDEEGNILDGDHLLAILAIDLKERGAFADNTLVATVMSNLGLFRFAQEQGIAVEQTKVGDKYVLETMLKKNLPLGGEQSGHLILSKHMRTGDGQLTALHILAAMKRSGKKLSVLGKQMERYPQTLQNLQVNQNMKKLLELDPGIAQIIQSAEEALGADGRILVRASGTEPLVRVMIEGRNQEEIDLLATTVVERIKERLYSIV